jgi:signal transduction histidine kinase
LSQLAWFFIGVAAGMGAAAYGAWLLQRRHTLRVRMAERRARAAERMAEIGAMTGGLAHEIKNPLSTIGLNAQLLQEAVGELELPEDERSRLLSRTTALRRETDRLGGILTDFLQYAGQVKLDRRPVDLSAAVGELTDFFLPEAERHGVKVRVESPREPVVAPVDVKLLKQALLNLMLNATQAMHTVRQGAEAGSGGGSLTLRIESGRDPDGRRVGRIHVIDSGPGIDADTLAKIFNPYFTTRAGGSGLGLPTSRRLIEEHGGRIDVESQPGAGSDFTVVVPLDAD